MQEIDALSTNGLMKLFFSDPFFPRPRETPVFAENALGSALPRIPHYNGQPNHFISDTFTNFGIRNLALKIHICGSEATEPIEDCHAVFVHRQMEIPNANQLSWSINN